jgi:hypothetical protein
MEHTINYADLTDVWTTIVDGGDPFPGSPGAADMFRGMWGNDPAWVGSTVAEMRDRVTNGFTAAGMDLKPSRNARPRGKYRYAEEGELQADLAMSGHDMPFLKREKVKRRAGMTLDVELAMLGDAKAETLAAYGEWVARLIQGLQQRGSDLEVNIVSRANGIGGKRETSTVKVCVKRFGRKSSLKSWGAIFSPAGFRMLVFTARGIMAEHHGHNAGGMGGSFGPAFGVEFDPTERRMTVRCAATGRFNTEHMDRQLAELAI